MLHVLYMSRGKLIIIHNPPFSSLCLSLSLCKNIGYLYSRRQNLLFVFLILSKVEKRLHDDVVLSITCFSFFISFFLSFSLSIFFWRWQPQWVTTAPISYATFVISYIYIYIYAWCFNFMHYDCLIPSAVISMSCIFWEGHDYFTSS